jgi:hypothetical protein
VAVTGVRAILRIIVTDGLRATGHRAAWLNALRPRAAKGEQLSPAAPIGIGTSIVLITVGAIFKYAINAGELFGILDIQVTGTILLIIGILGLVLAIAWTIMISNRTRPVAYDDRREVVREREREYEEPTRRRERF